MCFLSIAAFVGLVAAAHVSTNGLETRGHKLASRDVCAPGRGVNNGGQCRTCPVNTFSLGGNNVSCQGCPAGSSTALTGSIACVCNQGYRSLTGLTTGSPCSACPAGTSSGIQAIICVPCLLNTYSTSGGTCTACPSGTSSLVGAESCSPFNCSAGQYVYGNSCGTCPSGTYSTAGSTSCSDCPAGTISDPGSSTCAVCPGGSVPTSGGQSCRTCPANTYSSGDQCADCPAGSTSSPGSTSCGPQPSKRAVKPEPAKCSMPGYQRCAVLTGLGGSECINVLTTLDSCGGCVGPDGEEGYTGQDCSAIPKVDKVKCQGGRCMVLSCRTGFVAGQGACVPAPGKPRRMHSRFVSF